MRSSTHYAENNMTKPSTTTQETRELEPCPFCGTVPTRRDHIYQYGSIAEHPEGTHCPIENTTIGIAAWNKRANSAPSDTEQVIRLRDEALKGICVYCGEIQQYESLEQKASEEGNRLRVEHIKQCAKRPELKLIDEVIRLREALKHVLACSGIPSDCDDCREAERLSK